MTIGALDLAASRACLVLVRLEYSWKEVLHLYDYDEPMRVRS